MKRPTFSKLQLAITCPASMVIPSVVDIDEKPAAASGKTVHRFLELVSKARDADPELSALDARDAVLGTFELEIAAIRDDDERHRREEELDALRAIDVESLPTQLAAEVAFAWNWRTRQARELGRSLDRAYDVGPDEIPGTVDLLGVVERDGVRYVYVGDYKRGVTRYGRPGSYAQTLAGGLAAAQVYKADVAHLELIYLDSDGLSWPVHDEVDAWDLDGFADRIEAAMLKAEQLDVDFAAGRPLPLVTGKHCRYCESAKNCSATTAIVKASVEQLVQLRALTDGASPEAKVFEHLLAPDRIADTLRNVWSFRSLLSRLEHEIEMLARQEPLDMGNGEMYGPVAYERERLEGEPAFALLKKWYGEKAAAEHAKLSVSKDAAKKAISRYKQPKEKITTKKRDGVFDRFVAELRAQGAVRLEAGETVRTYKRKDS